MTIRVGFVMNQTVQGWMGGVNYLRNLFHALRSVPGGRIEPVLIVPPSTPDRLLASFPPVAAIRTRLVDRVPRVLRRTLTPLLGRDLAMERLLRAHGIDVLSHSEPLGHRAGLPSIGWIADFQHLVMPEFFTPQEIAYRDRSFRQTLDASTLMVVSSEAARRDLAAFSPRAHDKSRVLHFVSGYGEAEETLPLETLQARYGFDGPYFHLPNQFWAHKNHRLVVDALARLKARGTPALVLATGQTHAYRQPTLFDDLMRHVEAQDLAASFRPLGMLPYEDVAALMRHAVAVVNPSHFEGWSTSVEESKSFGIPVLLSDIPVHREQAPARGRYFPPDDPEALARALHEAQAAHRPDDEAAQRRGARLDLARRFTEFGLAYERLVLEALATHRPRATAPA